MMQPPTLRCAHSEIAWRFVIQNENGNDMRMINGSREGRVVMKAQILSEPQKMCRHVPPSGKMRARPREEGSQTRISATLHNRSIGKV